MGHRPKPVEVARVAGFDGWFWFGHGWFGFGLVMVWLWLVSGVGAGWSGRAEFAGVAAVELDGLEGLGGPGARASSVMPRSYRIWGSLGDWTLRLVSTASAARKSPAASASLARWMSAACGAGSVSGWEKSCAGRATAKSSAMGRKTGVRKQGIARRRARRSIPASCIGIARVRRPGKGRNARAGVKTVSKVKRKGPARSRVSLLMQL